MRFVPVFILETNNQTSNKFVQTDNASSSIKTAIVNPLFRSKKLSVSFVKHSFKILSCSSLVSCLTNEGLILYVNLSLKNTKDAWIPSN